jgi:YaiO family outer membrane protein
MGCHDQTRIYKCKRIIMKILFTSLLLTINVCLFAQKIDTDSLIVETNYELKNNKNFAKAIKLARLGIKEAPNYLDFHLALGNAYIQTKQTDSARYFLKYVIEKNTKYTDAFTYLANLELQEKNTTEATNIIEKAIALYPENKDFQLKKLQILNIENYDPQTIYFLETLVEKYPNDTKLKQQLTELKTKVASDRVGITYNNTTFSRNGVGPWHLIGLQYIRERKLLSIIARINYAERYNFGNKNSGIQYELETYFTNTPKSYSYTNVAYSYDDNVFPKLKLGYSYYYNFNKGWEADAGIRYTKTTNFEFYAAAIGIGKYVGSYWLNLKSYFQFFEGKTYPSFTATGRYYFNTKYDYLTAFIGTGTSPDERITLGQFENRFAFKSYRLGAGYNKILGQHYIVGVQASYNNQEYKLDSFQNEYDLFVSLQYKF